SSFGYRTHPILGTQRLHAGIDYAGGCGSPVLAPADGRVIAATVSGAGGNKLIIDHGVQRGVNLTTTYAHLSSYAVTSGSVSRGQLIAYVGTTGLSTACHLHFETRENGIAVDPRGWL
ncbi:MAG: M23 family metallopeptidase, partial [Ornithinimicrobium sp.]